MEINLKKRKITLTELSDFIESSQFIIENTLETLGWDESKLNQVQYKICPINPEHQIPEKALDKHLSACQLRQEGYSSDVEYLPDAGDSSESCIILDEKTRTHVIHDAQRKAPEMKMSCDAVSDSHPVPRTSDRIYTNTTPDERLALYDYVVEKTKHRHSHDLPLDLPFPDADDSKKSEPKSMLEVKAQERDAKRRRISYKRVHTNRKSHTEILSEVIRNQMEMLQSNVKLPK